MDESRLVGAEALIRWHHPRRGLVSPSEFISLAEEIGQILPLGRWVLETACLQMVAWARQPDMAHLTLAVNVSARQFLQPDFVSRVLAVLEHTGANPEKLKLELTESMFLNNVPDVIAKMSELKTCGLRFSLDDFGTGYSYRRTLDLTQPGLPNGKDHESLRFHQILGGTMSGRLTISEAMTGAELRSWARDSLAIWISATFGKTLPPNEHAVMVLDGAGWHASNSLATPDNITLVPLPPYSPESNPVERIWLFLRERFLSFGLWADREDIIDACCHARNALIADTDRIKTLCYQPWLQKVIS